jgi:hypothetical protein
MPGALRLDGRPRAAQLAPVPTGERLAVDGDLRVASEVVVPDPPRRQLMPEDLGAQAAASQAAA